MFPSTEGLGEVIAPNSYNEITLISYADRWFCSPDAVTGKQTVYDSISFTRSAFNRYFQW